MDDNVSSCLWHSELTAATGSSSAAGYLQKYMLHAMNGTRLFQRLDADLTECQDCMEAYHKARTELIKERPMCDMTIFQLEVMRIAGSLKQQSEQDILVPVTEVLGHPFLLLDPEIESAFCTRLLELNNSMALEGFLLQCVPSMYLLLVHPKKEVRELAWQILQHPDYHITIGNYDDISKVLEWVISAELQGNAGKKSGAQGAPRCPNQVQTLPRHLLCKPSRTSYWQGVAQLFEIFSQDALKHAFMTSSNMEHFIPNLVARICNYTDDAAASTSSFWWQLQCLAILMNKLGSNVWKAVDQSDLGIMFDSIKSHPKFTGAICKSGVLPGEHLDDSASRQLSSSLKITVGPTEPFRWMPPYINSLLDFGQLASKTFIKVISFLCSQLKDVYDIDFKGDEDAGQNRTRGLTRLDHLRAKLMRTLVRVLQSLLETSLLGALNSESITRTWLQTFATFLKKYPPVRAQQGLSLMSGLANDSRQFLIDVFKIADRSKANIIHLTNYLKMLRLPHQASQPARGMMVSPVCTTEKLWELDTDGSEFNDCVQFVERILQRHFCSSPASSIPVGNSTRGRRDCRSTVLVSCLNGTSKNTDKAKFKQAATSVTPKPSGGGESERNAFTDALKDIHPKSATSACKGAVRPLVANCKQDSLPQTGNPPQQEQSSPHTPLFVSQDGNDPEPTQSSENSTYDISSALDSDSDRMSDVVKLETTDEVYFISSLSEDSQSEAEDIIRRWEEPDCQPRVELETISVLQDLPDCRGQFEVISTRPLIIQRTRPENANWTMETHHEEGLGRWGRDGTDTDSGSSLSDIFSNTSSLPKRKHQKKRRRLSEDPDSPNRDSSWHRSDTKHSPQSLDSSSPLSLPGSRNSSPKYPRNRLSLTKKRKSQRLLSSSSDSDETQSSSGDIFQADQWTKYLGSHVKTERSFESKLTSSSSMSCQNPHQKVEGEIRDREHSPHEGNASCSKQLKFTGDEALDFLQDPVSPKSLKKVEDLSGSDSESNGSVSLLTTQAPRPVKSEDDTVEYDLHSMSIPNGESMCVSTSGEVQSSSDDAYDDISTEGGDENQALDPCGTPPADQLEDVKPPVHLLMLKTTSADLADASSSLHSSASLSFSEDQQNADEIIDLDNYNCSELYDDDCLCQLIEISSDEDIDLDQSEVELNIDLAAVKQEKEDDPAEPMQRDRAEESQSRSSLASQLEEANLLHFLNDNDDNNMWFNSYQEDYHQDQEEVEEPCDDEEKRLDNILIMEDEDENLESHPSLFRDQGGKDDDSRQDPEDMDTGTSDSENQAIPQEKMNHLKEHNTMFEIFQQNPHTKKKIIDKEARRKKDKQRRLDINNKQERQHTRVTSKRGPRQSTDLAESHKDLQGSRKDLSQPAPQSKIRGSWKPSSFQGPDGSPADAELLRRFRGSDQEPVLLDMFVLDSSQPGQRHIRASSTEEDRPRAAVQSRTDRFSSRTGSLFQDMKNGTPSKQSGPEGRPGSNQRSRHVSSPAAVRPSITMQPPTSSATSVLDTLPHYAQPAYVQSNITTYSVPQGAGASTDTAVAPESDSLSSANRVRTNSGPSQDGESEDVQSPSAQENGSPVVAPVRFQFFTSDRETLQSAASLTASVNNSLIQTPTPPAPNPQPVTSTPTDSSNRKTPSLIRQPLQQRPSLLEVPSGEGTSRMHREPARHAALSLHPQAGVQLPRAAPFTVEDLYYWVIGWNCQWLDIDGPESDSQPLSSVPPILAECPYRDLRDVPLTFNSLESYYSVFVPLLLREIWTQMLVKKPDASAPSLEGIFVKCKMKEQRATGYMWDCTCRVPLRDGAGCPISSQDVLAVMPYVGSGTSRRSETSSCSALFAIVTNVMPGLSVTSSASSGQTNHSVFSIGASTSQPEGNSVEVSLLILAKNEEVCQALKATEGHKVQLKVLHSLASAVRQFQGLIALPKCQLLATDILRFRRMDVFCPASETQPPITQPEKSLNPCQLKAVCIASKAVALPESLPRIFLLQGLPGTGKTHVVIELIKEIFRNQREPDQNVGHHSINSSSGAAALAKPPPILLCAPNNLVANVLLKRLVLAIPTTFMHLTQPQTREGSRRFHIVRVGRSSVIHESVKKYSLDNQVQAKRKQDTDRISHNQKERTKRRDSLQSKISRLEIDCNTGHIDDQIVAQIRQSALIKDLKIVNACLEDLRRQKEELGRKPDSHYEQAIITNADIICCTINMSGCQLLQSISGRDGRLRKMKYSCVIVDEANQCMELDSIIPLQSCSMKVVLIGDTQQLSATVTSKEAELHGLNQSLFERLSKWFQSSLDPRESSPLHLLTKQQRMPVDIAAFPSKHFYGGRLQSERTRSRRRDFFLHPYRVFNVRTSQESRLSPRTFTNEAEAKMVIEIYKKICTEKKRNPIMVAAQMSIGVIVPYIDQASYLLLLVKKADQKLVENKPEEFKLPAVDVSTMDPYQGREKDVVIISSVRALGASGNLSLSPGISSNFIGDRRKMSFVLTRARHSLIIVGHLQTLRKNKDWNALVADAERRNVIVNVPGTDYDIAAGCCINPAARRARRSTSSPAAAPTAPAAAPAAAVAAVVGPAEVRQDPGSQNTPAATSAVLPASSSLSLKTGSSAGNPARPAYHNQPKERVHPSVGSVKARGPSKDKTSKSTKQKVTFDISPEKVPPCSVQSLIPGPMQAALGVQGNQKTNPYAMNLKPTKQNGRSKKSSKLPQTIRGLKKSLIMYGSPSKFKYGSSARAKEKQPVESRMLQQSPSVPREEHVSAPRRNLDGMGRPSTDLGSALSSSAGHQLNPERDPRLSRQTPVKETPTDDNSKLQVEGPWTISLSHELSVKMRRSSPGEAAASATQNGHSIPAHSLKPPEQTQQPLRPSSSSLNAPPPHGRHDNSSRPATHAPLAVNPGSNKEQNLVILVENLKQKHGKEKRTLPLHGLQRDPKEIRKEARRHLSGTASAEHGAENSNRQGLPRHAQYFPESDSISD